MRSVPPVVPPGVLSRFFFPKKKTILLNNFNMVWATGIEPVRIAPRDFKPRVALVAAWA